MNSSPPFHALPAGEVLEQLQTRHSGLSDDEALTRLAHNGPNRLPEPQRRSAFVRFLMQFHNVLIYVLLGAALLTVLLDHLTDTLVILAVVLINALIGFIQEGKAESALQSIRRMLAPRASVLRDNQRHSVDAEQLVPGDIVLIEGGDKVPADIRLIDAHGISAQEAILTGESAPVDKHAQPVAANADLAERACLLFSGTLVTSGQARGVVIATGPDTEIGRISHLLSEVHTLVTPFVRQMGRFSRWLTGVILIIAAILLMHGYLAGDHDFGQLFMAVVSLSVAAIPEGLPAVLTITLAVGVQTVARRHVIVRRLPALETLGSVSVICTDKTGTLTRNEMMVVSVVLPDASLVVSGEGYAPEGDLRASNSASSDVPGQGGQRLALAACLCNDAELKQRGNEWCVEGDPMEGALLSLSAKMGVDWQRERQAWTRLDAIPFDTRWSYMATLHRYEPGPSEARAEAGTQGLAHASPTAHGSARLLVKGAPERIFAMCRHQRDAHGNIQVLDITGWQTKVESLASLGQRVLAFAEMPAEDLRSPLDHEQITGRLVLLGVAGMIDPPRPEAVAAIADCHSAGIRVKMITGDHARTAAAIAAQIGLKNTSRVLTGHDLETMDEATVNQAADDCDVFARTTPEHKLRLVMALQSRQLTIAMTGDGVNDAPALKRADVGVAMGGTGSEAAKEAAELVLIDDNFASIVAAIREGRTVYDNIKKVISWTLPTNAGEALTVIVALLLGLTLPITPVQLLWVNLITAVTLGLALAFEPTHENAMRRPPRVRDEPLLDATLAWHIILVSLLFLGGVYGIYQYSLWRGHSLEMARTLVVNTLVAMEIFHLLFIRNMHDTTLSFRAVRGTPMVWATIGIVTVAQLTFTYSPPFQRAFHTQDVALTEAMVVIGIGVLLFVITETEKQIRLRLVRH